MSRWGRDKEGRSWTGGILRDVGDGFWGALGFAEREVKFCEWD